MILKKLGFVFAGERNKIVDDQIKIVQGCGFVITDISNTGGSGNSKVVYMMKDIVIPKWTDTSKPNQPKEDTLNIAFNVQYGKGINKDEENPLFDGGYLSIDRYVLSNSYDDEDDEDEYPFTLSNDRQYLISHFNLPWYLSTDRKELIDGEKKIIECCSQYETRYDFWSAISKYKARQKEKVNKFLNSSSEEQDRMLEEEQNKRTEANRKAIQEEQDK